MLGAIIGDIIGSRFEGKQVLDWHFPLFTKSCHFTDDTLMTLGVAKGLMETEKKWQQENPHCDILALPKKSKARNSASLEVIKYMQQLGQKYPDAGFGLLFQRWLEEENPKPYGSFGNGGAMRISSAAYFCEEQEELDFWVEEITKVSHDTTSAITAAKAVAQVIFLARKGYLKWQLKATVGTFYPNLPNSLEEARKKNSFSAAAEDTVPLAFLCFFQGNSFEEVVRHACYLGGDTDTIASIAGSLAEAYYGIPENLKKEAFQYLPADLIETYRDVSLWLKGRYPVSPYFYFTKYLPLFLGVFTFDETGEAVDSNEEDLTLTIFTFCKEVLDYFYTHPQLLKSYEEFIVPLDWQKQLPHYSKNILLFLLCKLVKNEQLFEGVIRQQLANGNLFQILEALRGKTLEEIPPMEYFSYSFLNKEGELLEYRVNLPQDQKVQISLWKKEELQGITFVGKEEFQKTANLLQEIPFYMWKNNYLDPLGKKNNFWQVMIAPLGLHPDIYQGEGDYPPKWQLLEEVIHSLDLLLPHEEETYQYVLVQIPDFTDVYYYLYEGKIKVNERVCVPFGKDNELKIGRVITVGKYIASKVPYPLEKTKTILGILKEMEK